MAKRSAGASARTGRSPGAPTSTRSRPQALTAAVGINFNVKPQFAAGTARLLAGAGFKRARIEVGWGTLDYDDPSQMNSSDRRSLATTLTALREHGIRPLILLNANEGKPCPRSWTRSS